MQQVPDSVILRLHVRAERPVRLHALWSLSAVKRFREKVDKPDDFKSNNWVIAQEPMRARVSERKHHTRVEKHHALLLALLAVVLLIVKFQ